jgi:hypothetical protein
MAVAYVDESGRAFRMEYPGALFPGSSVAELVEDK